jgi:hypothetical protein
MNRREFCDCDLQWRELRLVGLDGRADCIRDVNSITLRELIDSGLRGGRKFSFGVCALFDAFFFLRKLASLHGRP